MVDYEWWERIGFGIDAAGGIVFLLLAALVLRAAPRNRINIAFVVFATGYGLRAVLDNLIGLAILPREASALTAMAWVTAAIGMGALWWCSPGRSGRHVATGIVLGLLPGLLPASYLLMRHIGAYPPALVGGGAAIAANYAFFVFVYALLPFVLFDLMSRDRAGALGGDTVTRWIAIAVLLFWMPRVGFQYGILPGTLAAGGDAYVVAVGSVPWFWLVAVPLLWAIPRRGAHSAGRRHARRMALSTLALGTLGVGFAFLTREGPTANLGLMGIARIVGVSLLAYAIVQHQIFDIQVKVKWTIKQSTVAAIFIAVFFIAGESAAALFGGAANNQYVGIAAAGILIFFLAPIQRLAQRLSDRAVPGAGMDGTQAERTYRHALDVAWRDGTIRPEERRFLRELRATLGLPAATYDRIEEEFDAGHAGR